MSTDENAPQLSPEAWSIVDQLADIARDPDPDTGETGGVEWYLPDEDPPTAALDELAAAGITTHERDGDSLVVTFTEAGRARFS